MPGARRSSPPDVGRGQTAAKPHRVSCYVPGTGLLHESHDVSPALLDYARKIVGSDADDPHMLGSYPLRPDHLAELARAGDGNYPLTHHECFLEAFVDDAVLALIRGRLEPRPIQGAE